MLFVTCQCNDAYFNVYTQTWTVVHTHTYTSMLKVADKHAQAHDYMTDKYTVLTSARVFNLHCLITLILNILYYNTKVGYLTQPFIILFHGTA